MKVHSQHVCLRGSSPLLSYANKYCKCKCSSFFISLVNICCLSQTALLVCLLLLRKFSTISAAFPHTEVHKQSRHRVSYHWGVGPSRACQYLLKNGFNSTPRKHFFSSIELQEACFSAGPVSFIMAADGD